jgi:hypothetical protein
LWIYTKNERRTPNQQSSLQQSSQTFAAELHKIQKKVLLTRKVEVFKLKGKKICPNNGRQQMADIIFVESWKTATDYCRSVRNEIALNK